jgi:hypothetical protein
MSGARKNEPLLWPYMPRSPSYPRPWDLFSEVLSRSIAHGGESQNKIRGTKASTDSVVRWSFWAVSAAGACIQVVGVGFFRETFAPALLSRKAKALRQKNGNQKLHTKWDSSTSTISSQLLQAFARPLRMLTTQPLLQVLSLYGLYTFGLSYLILASFAELWTTRYHQSIGISGLHYLALAMGYVFGTQTCARLISRIYKRLEKKNGGVGQPEHRLPLLFVGNLLIPAGLLIYGWSARFKVIWILPDTGILIFGFGIRFTTQCMQMYTLDVYPTYIASAASLMQIMRGISGFVFPIFAVYTYRRLGYGIGNTLLAALAFLIGMASLSLMWWCGPALRRRSQYAVG